MLSILLGAALVAGVVFIAYVCTLAIDPGRPASRFWQWRLAVAVFAMIAGPLWAFAVQAIGRALGASL